MQLIDNNISVLDLRNLASHMFGNLVKAVVDIKNKKIAIDAELHADLEAYLLDQGSDQQDLWGINLHPDNYQSENFVEFDSMINIRPNQNNPSRSVLDPKIQNQIRLIVQAKVQSN